MAEFNTQHWQKNVDVGASQDHSSSLTGMGNSMNNIQINSAAPAGIVTLDNKSGSASFDDHHHHHHHHCPLSFPEYSSFALHHHYKSSAASDGISPSSSHYNVNEKASSLIRRSRKKASDKDEVVRVRGRRGQASDSHSAAERVRREKINNKLRCLRELVPGCHKSMGMAVMLEEIINYVYSLQNQVEFLSMELAAAAAANMETQLSGSIPRASLQAKILAGTEDYGDVTCTYFHSAATPATYYREEGT